jgi:very-short-patch-repair endonuclease
MQSIRSSVRTLGGVAATHELLLRGHTADSLFLARKRGEIQRVRKGWYALPESELALLRAWRVGGKLACVSAAVHLGLWVPDAAQLHVCVPRRASRLRDRDDHRKRLAEHPDDALVVHWSRAEPTGDRCSVGLGECIDQLFRCQAAAFAFVVFESALNLGRFAPIEHLDLLDRLPRRVRRLAGRATAHSDSGTESLLKLELLRLGIPFIQQALIDGVGAVDFLIGERLVIEVDSRAHHSDPYRDRRRDAELGIRGYRVLRFMYSQIVYEWPVVEAAILAAMLRADHHPA